MFLVAEDDDGVLLGLASAGAGDDETSGSFAEIGSLYVLPDRHGQGVGGSLLKAACRELVDLGYSALRIGVLAANLPARAFYQAMGGREVDQRMFDEEGHLLPMTVYAWADITTVAYRG